MRGEDKRIKGRKSEGFEKRDKGLEKESIRGEDTCIEGCKIIREGIISKDRKGLERRLEKKKKRIGGRKKIGEAWRIMKGMERREEIGGGIR